MTTYQIRKSGNNNNGGTSPTVQATGTDGVTNGTNTLTAASNPFTAGMVGQGIAINVGGGGFVWRTISAFNSAGSINFSGATIAAHSGQTYNVGGAWLTVNQALVTATSIAAGDSVYIGAGVYRETIAVAVSGSAGSLISVIGDVDGAVTGDAGEVQLTNYTVNDKTLSNATLLAFGTTTYLAYAFLTLMAGGTNASPITNSAGNHDVSFTDCTIMSPTTGGIVLTSSTTGAAMNWTFERCGVFLMATISITLTTTASGAGDWDANVTIRNSLIISAVATTVTVAGSGAAVNHGGGVRVYNSTLFTGNIGFNANSGSVSSLVPCEIHSSLVIAAATGVTANRVGQLVEDHNLFYAPTARTNVAIGPGSISNNSYAPLLDIGQAYKVSGVPRPFLSPSSLTSPLLGFGSQPNVGPGPRGGHPLMQQMPPGFPGWLPERVTTSPGPAIGNVPIPTVDWANRPRPSGTQSNLTTVGYMEYHDFGAKDTVIYDVGPASLKLTGPGDQDLLVPVDPVSNTCSVRCRYDTAYGGQTFPALQLLANGEIGVTGQIAYAPAGGYGTWQTITLQAFTPTAAGWVKVRLISYDGSGLSQVNFDTFAVS